MNKNWNREETIIAFNVYCKIPFKDSNKAHPTIIKYASILGRTPSALNMKVGNIGRLDPDLKDRGITGLIHGAKLEKEVWDEFYNNPEQLAYESERLIAKFSKKNLENSSMIEISNLPEGKERDIIIKQRVNQSFFRASVMSAYNFKCCISGIGNPELLEACHITDWSQDIGNRTNPKNGLCMNPLFHKAYDKHLLAITPDFVIIVSNEMIENTENNTLFREYLVNLNGQKIIMPDKFHPRKDLLEFHYEQYKQIR